MIRFMIRMTDSGIRFVNDCGRATKFTTGYDFEETKGFLQKSVRTSFSLKNGWGSRPAMSGKSLPIKGISSLHLITPKART